MTAHSLRARAAPEPLMEAFRFLMPNPQDAEACLSIRKPGLCLHALRAFLASALGIFAGIGAPAQESAKNVLVLSGGPGRASINQMQSSLHARFPGPVNF